MDIFTPYSDFREAKISNINLRITPGLKAYLIRQGAQLGLNLSDYINLLIEQSGHRSAKLQELSGEAAALRQQLNEAQTRLQQLESNLDPLFVKTEGKTVQFGRDSAIIKTRLDLLQLLVKCFKITEP